MELQIKINLDNEAFENLEGEIARILRHWVQHIEIDGMGQNGDRWALTDLNGNTVGTARILA